MYVVMVYHGYVPAGTTSPPIMRVGSFSGKTLAGCSFLFLSGTLFSADAGESIANFVSSAREREEIFIVVGCLAFFVSWRFYQSESQLSTSSDYVLVYFDV